MAARETNIANAFETTLTVAMGATDLTASVATTTGGPISPAYLVIEPDSNTQREVIYFDGAFTGTTFVTSAIGNRYLSGSAAGSGLTHPIGAKVRCVPLKQHFEDINDRVDAKATDADVVHDTGAETIAGVKTFSSDPLIPDEVYGAGWNGSLEPPTKNAVYDKIETISAGTTHALVRKTADESVTSSTTLQNDDALLFAVGANEVWIVKFVLSIIGNTTGDFKAALTGPAGSTVMMLPTAGLHVDFDPSNSTASQSALNVKASGVSNSFGNSTFPTAVVLEGVIVNGATAGNLTLQWAQATSDGTATTVQANSFLIAHKVA